MSSTYSLYQFSEYVIAFEGNAMTCILTGVYLVIAGTNIYLLRQRKTHRILLLYTIIQLVLFTLFTLVGIYVTPGRTLAVFDIADPDSIDLALNTLSTWPEIVQDVTFILNICASDAFLLYRCYHIIHMQNKYAWMFPALLYLAIIGSSLVWLVVNSFPGADYTNYAVQLTGICSWSFSVAMNVWASSLISIRLWMHRRKICDAMGSRHGAFYAGYIAMTLESALLYTVFAIITLVVFVSGSPLQYVFIPVSYPIVVIAPSLIIYRIARGISFQVDECGVMTVDSIRFAPPSDAAVSANSTNQDMHSDGATAVPRLSSEP